jgi:hypothetical protein
MPAAMLVAAVAAATTLGVVAVRDDGGRLSGPRTVRSVRTHTPSAARSPATPSPPTFVLCGPKRDYTRLDVYVTQNDGRDLRRLTNGARVSGLTAANGVALAVVTLDGGWGGNGLIQMTPESSASRPGTLIPTSINMSGIPRLSRDGRYLGYVESFDDGHRGLRDAAMVMRRESGAKPRRVADAHNISDLDFDARNRLHVLTAVSHAGSEISAGDSGRTQVVLRRRTFMLRYSPTGRLALGGDFGAEIRASTGRLIARRRDLVVHSWARDGRRVLVRRRKDDRLAYWDYVSNKLSLWPRLHCGLPYLAEQ